MRFANYERTHRNYYVICKEPLIIMTNEGMEDLGVFSEKIGNERKTLFLVSFKWTLEIGNVGRTIKTYYDRHQISFPNHEILFFVSTAKELRILKKLKLPVEFIHQNALLDPGCYSVDAISEKKYDIVYNGRLEHLKRHHLLSDKFSTVLVSGNVLNVDDKKINYLEFIKKIIPNAYLANADKELSDYSFGDNYRELNESNINSLYNQSKVGVILSAIEGPNYTSVEYLLAGIPVVSTYNIGGRDEFLDPRFCRIVPSTRKAIEAAIEELISFCIDPCFIREETIKKMRIYELKYKKILHAYLIKSGWHGCFENFWDNIRINKMIKYSTPFFDDFENSIGL